MSVVGNESTFLPGIVHPEAGGSLFVTFQSSQVQLKQISAQIVFNLKRWVQIAPELPEARDVNGISELTLIKLI